VVLLGDSELLKNGFGLMRVESTPLYAGNWILAQRMAAWLLDLPFDQWPSLPQGFTWMAVDGQNADWQQLDGNSVADGRGDALVPALDITRAQAFSDGDYLYVLIETGAAPAAGVRVDVTLSTGTDSTDAALLVAGQSGVYRVENGGAETLVADASVAIGSVIELRVPLREAAGWQRIERLCVGVSDVVPGAADDCLDQALEPPVADSQAPFDFALVGHPLVTVTRDGVNVRSAPGTE